MKKKHVAFITIILLIGVSVGSSSFVLDLSASAKNSHLITHEFNLISGNSVCFQDSLTNNEKLGYTKQWRLHPWR